MPEGNRLPDTQPEGANQQPLTVGLVKNRVLTHVRIHDTPRDAGEWKMLADTLLTLRTDGRYQKVIKGRRIYYGRDPQAAVQEYLRTKDDYEAGREPPPATETVVGQALTVDGVFSLYLESRKGDIVDEDHDGADILRAGAKPPKGDPDQPFTFRRKMRRSTWFQYKNCLGRFTKVVHPKLVAETLTPRQFDQVIESLYKEFGPGEIAKTVKVVNLAFAHAHNHGYIAAIPPRGSNWRSPPKSLFRAQRRKREQAGGEKMFTEDEIKLILDNAKYPLKAMILLAMNCGFLGKDCATLRVDDLDLDEGVHDKIRGKTNVLRRGVLWPETIDALKIALKTRPAAKDPKYANLVFITREGGPYISEKRVFDEESGAEKAPSRSDAIAQAFSRLLTKCGIKRHWVNFSALRPTFRTVADEKLDDKAAKMTMGHSFEGIDEFYVKRVSMPRLKTLSDYVRTQLLPADHRMEAVDAKIRGREGLAEGEGGQAK